MRQVISILSLAIILAYMQPATPAAGCYDLSGFPCMECVSAQCGGRTGQNNSTHCACLITGSECPPCNPPACDCFLAGTPVETPNGAKAIEEIRVGDSVVSLSSNGTTSRSTVTDVYRLWRWEHYVINKSIKATAAQPFWVRAEDLVVTAGEFGGLAGMWRGADELQIGDELLGVNGEWTTVKSIERIDQAVRVYNINVDGSNVFFAHGHLVHNKGPCDQF